jgi:hypothetical protein
MAFAQSAGAFEPYQPKNLAREYPKESKTEITFFVNKKGRRTMIFRPMKALSRGLMFPSS